MMCPNFKAMGQIPAFHITYFLYVYVARAYTLASTVGAIVQYCLRNRENLHISVRLLLHFIRFCHSFYVRRC